MFLALPDVPGFRVEGVRTVSLVRALAVAVASVGAVVALLFLAPSGSGRTHAPPRPASANASPETRVANPSAVTVTPLGHGPAPARITVRPAMHPRAPPVEVTPLSHG